MKLHENLISLLIRRRKKLHNNGSNSNKFFRETFKTEIKKEKNISVPRKHFIFFQRLFKRGKNYFFLFY